MADQATISLVVDKIVAAFNGDPNKFEAFLTRAALETELAELESQARNLQAAQDADNAAHQAALVANAEARAQKQAEIDAL